MSGSINLTGMSKLKNRTLFAAAMPVVFEGSLPKKIKSTYDDMCGNEFYIATKNSTNNNMDPDAVGAKQELIKTNFCLTFENACLNLKVALAILDRQGLTNKTEQSLRQYLADAAKALSKAIEYAPKITNNIANIQILEAYMGRIQAIKI